MSKYQKAVHIVPIETSNLYRFAAGFINASGGPGVSPITLARASAQMKNPVASKSDTALFAAFEGGRCVGYHGQLPGLLATQNGIHRVLWGSTFFVMDEYRGKGLGRAFLKKVTELNHDFVTTRITPQARKALLGFGLKTLGCLKYYQLRIERAHFSENMFEFARKRLLGAFGNRRAAEATERIEKMAADVEKSLFYASIRGKIDKMFKDHEIVPTDGIKHSDFLSAQPPSAPRFLRDPQIINWMLRCKWIFSDSEKMEEISNYHFSGPRELFAYFPLKLHFRRTGEYRGFLVLCASARKGKTSVRVLDNQLKNDGDIHAACAAALLLARQYNADRVELPLEWGDRLKKIPKFRRYLKEQTREYLYYPKGENSPLEGCKNEIRLDYCDGDVAFT